MTDLDLEENSTMLHHAKEFPLLSLQGSTIVFGHHGRERNILKLKLFSHFYVSTTTIFDILGSIWCILSIFSSFFFKRFTYKLLYSKNLILAFRTFQVFQSFQPFNPFEPFEPFNPFEPFESLSL